MIPLLLSILSSSAIFAIFKLFERFKIDTFQAIVFNYFTAFFIGIILYGHQWNEKGFDEISWFFYAVICALLFIGLFLIMGRSSQINGVASTSVAVKMSTAISIILMIVGYSEKFTALKASGILLALVSVFLVSYTKGKKAPASWMLLVLFFGSGTLDFVLNYVQNFELKTISTALFSAFALGLAGVLGALILSVRIIQGSTKIELKNIAAGIVLGIPNYFSIYLLIHSYRTTGWQDSTVLAVTNVSVVLLSSLIGFLAFEENATSRKIIGLISAILAIVILSLANK
ncbi:MAG: DMT family transporter [Crocinitomicaceae bacterium]|jgi:drug/metabolite transporter (DMT)-like permease|nr:DMT family transporter [Crocinitomicaceae bacterium]